MNREHYEEHHHEEKCLPDSDEIWCDDFWIYIVIAIGGFLFFILAGILGNGKNHLRLWMNHELWPIIWTPHNIYGPYTMDEWTVDYGPLSMTKKMFLT